MSSCRACALCKAGEEQFCAEAVFTYNAAHKSGEESQGGYSSHIVVDEGYAYAIAPNLDPAGAAPLLCAGITTYSPYVLYGLNKPGLKIGVVGIGGLVRAAAACSVRGVVLECVLCVVGGGGGGGGGGAAAAAATPISPELTTSPTNNNNTDENKQQPH